jgi:hypothetical protein
MMRRKSEVLCPHADGTRHRPDTADADLHRASDYISLSDMIEYFCYDRGASQTFTMGGRLQVAASTDEPQDTPD